MKEVIIYYTATWSTSVEVPDDFVPDSDSENLYKLVRENEADFDFQDGGASWDLDSFEFDGESIEA